MAWRRKLSPWCNGAWHSHRPTPFDQLSEGAQASLFGLYPPSRTVAHAYARARASNRPPRPHPRVRAGRLRRNNALEQRPNSKHDECPVAVECLSMLGEELLAKLDLGLVFELSLTFPLR